MAVNKRIESMPGFKKKVGGDVNQTSTHTLGLFIFHPEERMDPGLRTLATAVLDAAQIETRGCSCRIPPFERTALNTDSCNCDSLN